jgi:hypothetical protein
MGSSIWNRAVSGSVVSGSEEWKAATKLSDYVYKKFNSFYKSGEVRYLRLAGQQTINDSIVPDPLLIYETGSYGAGAFVKWERGSFLPTPPSGYTLLLFSEDGLALTGSDTKRVNNIEWQYSFPFEKKYAYVAPEINSTNATLSVAYYFAAQGGAPPYNPIFQASGPTTRSVLKSQIAFGSTKILTNPVSKSINILVDYAGYYDPSLPPNPLDIFAQWQAGADIGIYDNITQRNMFFFGINPTPIFTKYSQRQGDAIANQGPYSITGSVNNAFEGWKYGLYNGISTNFSCVFRQNHYGQPRDMLEGRIYTKTYNNPAVGGPLDADGGINFISASALAGESDNWLTASIYGSTNVAAAYAVNPYGSGIFDKEYRASQPWFDNDPRVGT